MWRRLARSRTTWGEGEEGSAEVSGEPGEVPVRPRPSDPVRVHAEAQLVAESGGDLVQHPGAQAPPAVEFRVVGRPAAEDPGVHRLLQPDHVQADQVALLPQAAQGGWPFRIAFPGSKY